jgi:hypothetical protein
MQCPNCSKDTFVERPAAGKFECVTCGWFEQVDGIWKVTDAPASEQKSPAQEQAPLPAPAPAPKPAPKPAPAPELKQSVEVEPGPEDSQTPKSEPNPDQDDNNVKQYLGGLITVTEVDEDG